jgi:hypothetical protein
VCFERCAVWYLIVDSLEVRGGGCISNTWDAAIKVACIDGEGKMV